MYLRLWMRAALSGGTVANATTRARLALHGLRETLCPPAALDSRDVPGTQRLFSMAAVIGAATIFGLTHSLSAPLIAVDLSQRGYSATFIGANAAMHAVGVLLITAFLPRLTAAAGARPTPASDPLHYMRLAPLAMATTVLNAAIETAALSFIALYAARARME